MKISKEEVAISQEMSRLMSRLEDEDVSPKEAEAIGAALKGLAQTRAELAKERSFESDRRYRERRIDARDVLHESVEVFKCTIPLASLALTYHIWKQSLKIDKLGEIVTTNVGKNILRGHKL